MAHSVLLPTCFVGSPGSSPSYKIFEKKRTNNKQQKRAKREKQWQLA